MEDTGFDKALIGAAFEIAAQRGWAAVTVADAARDAGLSLEQARDRFPRRNVILLKLGRMADQAALAEADDAKDDPVRDRLFGMVMKRIDALQAHRAGVLAMFRAMPAEPFTALMLASTTMNSMAWLLDGAGIPTTGVMGRLHVNGLFAVWLAVVRAWSRDESEDLTATLAALDKALDRAERASAMLGGRRVAPAAAEPETDIAADEAMMDAAATTPITPAAAEAVPGLHDSLPRTSPPPDV